MILGWPFVAVLGFLALAVLVIVLGRSSTARYEFERNLAQAQRAPARTAGRPAGPAAPETGRGTAPAGPGRDDELPERTGLGVRAPSAVGIATHPTAQRTAPVSSPPAWWLVDEATDELRSPIVAGPFTDQIAAEWAALSAGLPGTARARHGVRRSDGAVLLRQTPQERAWLAELGEELDRLGEDWDELLTDDDALTTLAVEVTAALVEAGLSLADRAGHEPAAASGGVCLTPAPAAGGLLVSWRQHDRMSVQQARGAAIEAAVQRSMSAAVADVLRLTGFTVEPVSSTGCHLVSTGRT